jgi:hypothetical protein
MTKSFELDNSLGNKNSVNEKSINQTPNVNLSEEIMPFQESIISPYQNH